ncbi:flavodoxin family protein [Fusobacterium varium]|uniref:flavodoxin family protein n=1 Tax=Fusobacterium varium TaxID=856 RepID=UPI000E50833F|nr:flavodoxin family protein [Fusobacterium varium]RHG35352.1 flavodoxin family protein [Fusobacterium varium]
MKKNVLIISTSPRKGGNSDILADEFRKGALESGHQVKKINLYDKTINFCKGCLICQSTKKCIIKDDANDIIEQMLHADVLVFATPIYFYEMCGQMKTLLDRTNPLFPSDYLFTDIYLLATAADNSNNSMDGAIKGLQGWIDCFEKTSLKGVVKGLGADSAGSIRNFPDTLKESFNLGKNI